MSEAISGTPDVEERAFTITAAQRMLLLGGSLEQGADPLRPVQVMGRLLGRETLVRADGTRYQTEAYVLPDVRSLAIVDPVAEQTYSDEIRATGQGKNLLEAEEGTQRIIYIPQRLIDEALGDSGLVF